jgi:hypothetical protein
LESRFGLDITLSQDIITINLHKRIGIPKDQSKIEFAHLEQVQTQVLRDPGGNCKLSNGPPSFQQE